MHGMMLRVVFVMVLLLAAVATGQDFNLYGFSTVDFSYLGSGARALAMGGAFTGVADDASALTWNPAGLIQVDKTQVAVAGSYLVLEQKTSVSYPGASIPGFSATEDDNKLKLSYASFVAPLRIKGHPFMTSATYRSAKDRLEDWYSASLGAFFYQDATGEIHEVFSPTSSHTTVTGGVDIFSFGFGTGLYGDLAVGGSVNVYSGSGEAFNRFDASGVVETEYAGTKETIFLDYAKSVADEFSTKGFSLTGSLFYQRDIFRAGVKVETPFELIYEHDLERRDTLYENGLPVAGPAVLYRGKTKLEMPWALAGGMSITPRPNLLLSADLEYRQFSEATYVIERDTLFTQRGSIYFPYHCIDVDTCAFSAFTASGDREEVFDEFNINLESSMQVRLGAEYQFETEYGTIPIRVGGSLMKMQYSDVDSLVRDAWDHPMPEDPEEKPSEPGFRLGDSVTRTSLSFGSGIHWNQIWLDFAVIWSSEEQLETGFDVNGSFETTRERSFPGVVLNFTGFF